MRAQSGGFEPGPIRGLPTSVMEEVGLSLPEEPVPSVFEHRRSGQVFDYVVCMCDDAGTELCDVFRQNIDVLFAKAAQRVVWSVGDFAALKEKSDRLRLAAELRDQIRLQVAALLESLGVETDRVSVYPA